MKYCLCVNIKKKFLKINNRTKLDQQYRKKHDLLSWTALSQDLNAVKDHTESNRALFRTALVSAFLVSFSIFLVYIFSFFYRYNGSYIYKRHATCLGDMHYGQKKRLKTVPGRAQSLSILISL